MEKGCERTHCKTEGSMSDYVSRFMAKVQPVTESGCWIWMGAAGRYGNMQMNKKHMDAHRASWLLFNGEIPNGMCVLHKCDVPLCVNPRHLFVATHRDNTHDMIRKGRHRFATWNAPRGEAHWRRRHGI
jgi:hypothetical protein